jgi:hypothetical protein
MAAVAKACRAVTPSGGSTTGASTSGGSPSGGSTLYDCQGRSQALRSAGA